MPVSGPSSWPFVVPSPYAESVFTGIVEELGRLRRSTSGGSQIRLEFGAPVVAAGSRIGDSISVNGCCLTVVDVGDGWWAGDAVAETLGRTNLGELGVGDPVNLERSVRLEDRLGGHLVQGHVDGVGRVVHPGPDLQISAPSEVVAYLVPKGSVTVDGCSLTIVDVLVDGFTVALIPHTADVTTLGTNRPGDAVNLEVDVIAKYVRRLLAAGIASPYVSGGR